MALRADDVDLGRDRDLVARFQNGDPEAFDDLYRCYFDRLRRYCQRQTNDQYEAEEIAQEAFVKALRSMNSLRGERRFYPWMTVIAKRIVIDRHRKMSRVELTDEPDMRSVEPDHDHLFAAVDAAHVRAALDNVGPRHREVLLLREAESMSYADIAGELDVPVTTVEALLHRARKALRREYQAVTGGRGMWGLPVLGWLGDRARAIRGRVDDRWADLVAFAAPVAVGAITAAVVLVPSGQTDDVAVQSARRPVTPVTVDESTTATPSAPSASSGVDPTIPPLSIPPQTTTSPDAAPAPPSIEAGPVDIYFGPEGTETAREKAEDMPVGGSIGDTSAGIDPPELSGDVSDAVENLLEVVLGRQGDTP